MLSLCSPRTSPPSHLRACALLLTRLRNAMASQSANPKSTTTSTRRSCWTNRTSVLFKTNAVDPRLCREGSRPYTRLAAAGRRGSFNITVISHSESQSLLRTSSLPSSSSSSSASDNNLRFRARAIRRKLLPQFPSAIPELDLPLLPIIRFTVKRSSTSSATRVYAELSVFSICA